MANVLIYPDPHFLAQAAAEKLIEAANQAVRERGVFSIALSGGSTPQVLYELLASEPFSERVDWSRMQIFWGDERCVPPDHPNSNFFKAQQTLFNHVPLPPDNIHRIPAEMPPEQAAELYEETLLKFFSGLASEEDRTNARFDLVLLGMGDDGHTASLFPGTPAINEERRWVTAQYIDKLAAWRITLTPVILNRAKQILFLISGAGKSYTLQRVIYGTYMPDRYPAQVIRPTTGDVAWLVDEAAAALF
jgi:6-phosphogluconolactonase